MMNVAELQSLIDTAVVAIGEAMQKPEADEADKKIADLALMGIAVFGELLLDIKRIADATERAVSQFDDGPGPDPMSHQIILTEAPPRK